MVSALTLVAAWGGPIAIAFALVGCVILIVYALTHSMIARTQSWP